MFGRRVVGMLRESVMALYSAWGKVCLQYYVQF